ncbi:MAG: transporter substrate-binding domain-containing protein [Spirochaetaceae bacterium]|jgi:ABC-type amino acid transport substrate-binding protein|nr:transporter substrate-binding domain-containing protein [Spirochaetaceae bacterium]
MNYEFFVAPYGAKPFFVAAYGAKPSAIRFKVESGVPPARLFFHNKEEGRASFTHQEKTGITSTITTVMTTSALSQTAIESLQDLGGARIGVLNGSIGEMILDSGGYNLVPLDTAPIGWNAVGKHDVDAFVCDAPVLEYYNSMYPNKNIRLLDGLFHPERYAFAAHDIDFANRLSRELIRLYEDGTLGKLKLVYVGE